jgi:hypothetical protein
MELKNERQAKNTRQKLQGLEEHYCAALRDLSPDDHIRLISLQSIKRMINQMKEELARYEARTVSSN